MRPPARSTSQPQVILQVRGLHFAHPGQPPLFNAWSFDLASGVTWLQGDMGSGKTSLLRLLAGERAAEGAFTLAGTAPADDRAAYRRAIAWLDARDPAYDELTPAAFMQAQRQRFTALDEAAWQQHVQAFGLQPHLGKTLRMLSTGSRHKAALAVALASRAVLTLLDEPTAGLDAPSVRHLTQALCVAARDRDRALLLVCSQPLDLHPLAGVLELPAAKA